LWVVVHFLLVQDLVKLGTIQPIIHINHLDMSNNKVFLGIITAAIAGAVIGLLFAPEDGNETRKKIKKKTNNLATDLIDALEKSKAKAEGAVDDLKDEGRKYADEAANKAAEYTDAAREQVNKYQ
jgi:gas vesicle protein